MSTSSSQTLPELQTAFLNAFNAALVAAGLPPVQTDNLAVLQAFGNAASLLYFILNNGELAYAQSIDRLATIPDLAGGALNPDSASFGAPWNVVPLGASSATGELTVGPFGGGTAPSQLIVPAGAIFENNQGIPVLVTPGGAGYNTAAGGYPITAGSSSTTVPGTTQISGTSGNIGTGVSLTASNTAALPFIATTLSGFNNAVNGELNAAYKQRFTTQVSTGNGGTQNAIIAGILELQPGVICSYGDRVNPDGSSHSSFFTVVVNLANTGTTAPSSLVTAAMNQLLGAPRAGGIEYTVVGPTMIDVNSAATITPLPGVDSTALETALVAAHQSFVNGIGLNSDTTPTLCSYLQYGAMLFQVQVNGAPAVANVDGLTLNGATADLSAPFASQFAAGTASFTIA